MYSIGPEPAKSPLTFIFNSIRWSVLAVIGRTPAMRVISSAPLIGYLILLNDYTVTFTNKTFELIGFSEPIGLISTNLYLLYYGSLVLGLASIIFAICCPTPQNRCKNEIDYANYINANNHNIIQDNNLDYIAKSLSDNYSDIEEKVLLHYPLHVYYDSEGLFNQVTLDLMAEDPDLEFFDIPENKNISSNVIFTGSGYIVASTVAEIIYMNPKVVWHFTRPFKKLALSNYGADIATLTYMVHDYSKPYMRFLVALLYFFGFSMIIIPAIKVFFKVINVI